MKPRRFFASLTRISDLAHRSFKVKKLPREQWELGDYVEARVIGRPHKQYKVELTTGRMMKVMEDDHVIGAFGKRAATLGGVGDWEAIGDDLELEALTSAGLFGKALSTSLLIPDFMDLKYTGHIMRDGHKVTMQDFVEKVSEKPLEIPVILLVGTSMSAGKTTTGRLIIHELKQVGWKVVAAKFTGAGRYRDALTFGDAGADHFFDFVDVGLPSTVVSEKIFCKAFRILLSRIAHLNADVLVAEMGASPLEPYNGAAAIKALKDNVCCTVLSASDPYAVVGVQTAFGLTPDLVTGPATSTDAAINLVDKLTGIKALNIMDPASIPELRRLLEEVLPRRAHVMETSSLM